MNEVNANSDPHIPILLLGSACFTSVSHSNATCQVTNVRPEALVLGRWHLPATKTLVYSLSLQLDIQGETHTFYFNTSLLFDFSKGSRILAVTRST